jgi:signal peptidase II
MPSTHDPDVPDAPSASRRQRGRHILVLLLIVAGTIGGDRLTKMIAQAELASGSSMPMLGGVVRWQYEENRGVMLSLGSSLSASVRFLVFTVGVGVLLAGLAVFVLARGKSLREIVAGSLAVGGGLGNLLDRILYNGAVIDFVSVGIGPVRTGVFNAADVAVFLGVGLFVLFAFRPGPARTEVR